MASPISDAMAGMTAAERAAYKASVYGSRPTPDALTAGTRMTAIVEGPTYGYLANGVFSQTPGGVPVVRTVLALWIDYGTGFQLIDLDAPANHTSTWGGNPLYLTNPPILVPDPGGDITRTWTNPDGSTGSLVLREDPDQALMQACMDAVENIVGPGNEM
jgi:hypothetical protein